MCFRLISRTCFSMGVSLLPDFLAATPFRPTFVDALLLPPSSSSPSSNSASSSPSAVSSVMNRFLRLMSAMLSGAPSLFTKRSWSFSFSLRVLSSTAPSSSRDVSGSPSAARPGLLKRYLDVLADNARSLLAPPTPVDRRSEGGVSCSSFSSSGTRDAEREVGVTTDSALLCCLRILFATGGITSSSSASGSAFSSCSRFRFGVDEPALSAPREV